MGAAPWSGQVPGMGVLLVAAVSWKGQVSDEVVLEVVPVT